MSEDKSAGLYRKFEVARTDGGSREGRKHHGCDYFVLDWIHDPFTIPAARAYANACKKRYPRLAADLLARIAVEKKRPPHRHKWLSRMIEDRGDVGGSSCVDCGEWRRR